MNRSRISFSKRLQIALYPFAFPIAAIILGFVTYQIVNRLAIETASTKLTTIANTGATAVSEWAENHQNAIEFFAAGEVFEQSAIQLARENVDAATSRVIVRSIEQEFGRFSGKFDCLGFALLSHEGNPLHVDELHFDSTSEFVLQLGDSGTGRARNGQSGMSRNVSFDLKSGAVYFAAPVGRDRESGCTLVVAISAASGLHSILESVEVGGTGFAFLINGAANQDWKKAWPLGRKPSPATSKMLDAALLQSPMADRDSDQNSLLEEPTNLIGLDGPSLGEYVGAQKRLANSRTSLVTIVERGEVFKATLVMKRILLLILGLSILASVMNWMYVLRLSTLRTRVSDASDTIRRLGQYNLEEKIGEGGMGVVYRASHSMLQRPTAVKLILPDRASDSSIKNFEREVMLTSRLTHPNTIAIYDYGRNDEGIFYYAMEYLNGINLATLVCMEGPQPWQRVVHILSQVCDSLAEAHSSGLIHRDIKPENVMLCQRGNRHDVVKVLDFGLAGDFSKDEKSEATRVHGTPAYMAPEAILKPDQIDPRVDVYAVGAVGYFLLAGRHIFSGETASAILSQQLNSKPIPLTQRRPEISEKLQALVMACLEKDRDKRPARIEDLRHELVALSKNDWTEKDARAGWLRIQEHRSTTDSHDAVGDVHVVHSISKTLEF